MFSIINISKAELKKSLALTLYSDPVVAGFPSPATDFMEGKLDLNEHLIQNPAATFFVKVTGDSMIGAGIHTDDLLIVDRSTPITHGRVIIAVLDGELTVKRLERLNGQIRLIAENPNYPAIAVTDQQDFSIWGVVTNVIHPL